MTRFSCKGDWLVEYADGELTAADSAQAELHLTACPGCTREVAALRSSREILSTYFAAADGVRPIADLRQQASSQTGWNAAAMALASLAAAVLLVSAFFFLGRERGEVVRAATPKLPVPSLAAEEPEEEDVLAMISRETQIARLRTASEILAKEPGMNDRHLAMEKYLAEAYGVTPTRRPFEM